LSILTSKLATSSHKTRLEHFLFFGAADQFGIFSLLCMHNQNKVLLLLISSGFSPAADQIVVQLQDKQQKLLILTPTREPNKLKQPNIYAVRMTEKRMPKAGTWERENRCTQECRPMR
jgi:hypothetical protein